MHELFPRVTSSVGLASTHTHTQHTPKDTSTQISQHITHTRAHREMRHCSVSSGMVCVKKDTSPRSSSKGGGRGMAGKGAGKGKVAAAAAAAVGPLMLLERG